MVTYKHIQDYVKKTYGYVPKSCWIAHVKELNGLNPKIAPNRRSATIRKYPCPQERQEDIRKAFAHFGLL